MGKDCKHLRWNIRGWYPAGYCRCLDCEEEIPANVAFDNLRIRMEKVMERIEKRLAELENGS